MYAVVLWTFISFLLFAVLDATRDLTSLCQDYKHQSALINYSLIESSIREKMSDGRVCDHTDPTVCVFMYSDWQNFLDDPMNLNLHHLRIGSRSDLSGAHPKYGFALSHANTTDENSWFTENPWHYQRIFVYANPHAHVVDFDEILAENGCGVNGFKDDPRWCLGKNFPHFILETRHVHARQYWEALEKLDDLISRLAAYFNANAEFPSKDKDGNVIVDASFRALAEMNAFGSCTGIGTWQGMPFSCEEVFFNGHEVRYHFFNDAKIVFYVNTGLPSIARPDGIIVSRIIEIL